MALVFPIHCGASIVMHAGQMRKCLKLGEVFADKRTRLLRSPERLYSFLLQHGLKRACR
jgi:hypothetical protein